MCFWLIWEIVNLVLFLFLIPFPFFLFSSQIPMVWKKPKTSENRQKFKMYLEGYRAGVLFTSGLKALYVLLQK